MTIDKTIKSKYQPKQTNVTWVDLSGETPVEKHFINGRWRPIGGGGSTNPGYSSTKQTVTLFNDTIEMLEQQGIYTGVVQNPDFDLVAGENYTVVFDGASYDVKAIPSPFQEGFVILGEIDDDVMSFDTYPFAISYGEQGGIKGMMLSTNTEGSHVVEIKHEEETITTTPEFKDAVDSVTGYSIGEEYETLYEGTVETVDDDGYIYGVITPGITFVEGDTYKVTLNGTEYNCKCLNNKRMLYVGAQHGDEGFDWSTYPFRIDTYNDLDGGQLETELCTNQEGSYILKIEHLTTSTKTTPAFESMIQGIGGSANCRIIYPDDIVWDDGIYSIYNKAPEVGNIYFMPLTDDNGRYLYPVHIDTFNFTNGTGTATIIGNIIGTFNDALVQLSFSGAINPSSSRMSGLQIANINREYRFSYKAGNPFG